MRKHGTHAILSFFTALALLWCVTSCGGSGSGGLFPGGGSGMTTTVMGNGTVPDGSYDWPYYLLKFERFGKDPSYAIWFPSYSGGTRPAVMNTMPYDGMTWDADTPDPSEIHDMTYYLDMAHIYLYHDFNVILVFGRFYTGGSIQNDLDDMIAGFEYLKTAKGVDCTRIAIYGGSWGGFEALYAAANAPEGVVPKAGVAFFPVSDFQKEMSYIQKDIPTITDPTMNDYYKNFFVPYTTRIEATVGDPADYTGWTSDDLLGKLKTPFLVLHDEWDSLVPFTGSQYLVSKSAGLVVPVWYYRPAAYDVTALSSFTGHQDLRATGFSLAFRDTLAFIYIINRIADSGQAISMLYDDAALTDFMGYLHEYKCDRGKDMAWAATRLGDLVDTRVTMIEIDTLASDSGASLIAAALNAAWGTSYDKDTIGAALASDLPACK